MKLAIDTKKSVEKNAEAYYEKSKKLKKKLKGAEEALQKSLRRLEELKTKSEKEREAKGQEKGAEYEKKWYHKFRWFTSSEGFLVVGGRDATSNEIVIKKHTEEQDIVLHTDMAGSPFFVIKSDGKIIGEETIKEAADATVTFSRAWKLGMQTTPVFYVKPEQVSKKAQSGEYLTKGAFMIRGKTNYIGNRVNCAVGITEQGEIMSGPVEAIKKHCKKYTEIEQGREKASAVAKKIRAKTGGSIDEIVRALPSGGCSVKK